MAIGRNQLWFRPLPYSWGECMQWNAIKFGARGISNLQDRNLVEYILPGEEFGPMWVQYQQGGTKAFLDGTVAEPQELLCNKDSFCCTVEDESLKIRWEFRLVEGKLKYSIEVENLTQDDIEIIDAAIVFPMNTKFEWNENAAQKVIRHSHIAQHNSYLFFQRVNGEAPYLLVTPKQGVSLEYYDLKRDKKNDGTEGKQYELYQAYLHAAGQEQIARSHGCNWRQPVSKACVKKGGRVIYAFTLQWVEGYEEIRRKLGAEGLIDIRVVPGMTVPLGTQGRICLRTNGTIQSVRAEYPEKSQITLVQQQGGQYIYEFQFYKTGENKLMIDYNNGSTTLLEFFVTEAVEVLLRKRAAFIARRQYKNPQLWYDGLFAEWNNEAQKMLSPDDYDKITGWRIYEVTCDDPGLSKPAFLAAKNAVSPCQQEITALDYYISTFVWGGLQRTTQEEYPYGIYGIPDWHQNRNSEDKGVYGQRHIWRIYDYPHIALLYFSMYQIARDYPLFTTALGKQVYLERAYQTMVAMFNIPQELVDWSAFKTGLYNELIMQTMFEELQRIGETEKAGRLQYLWEKKVQYFICDCKDIFGSEYPFDTTGFESTHAFGRYAIDKGIGLAKPKEFNPEEFCQKAKEFFRAQAQCNIACRGYLEPAYYLYGSDIRGNNAFYTLSYMSQMAAAGVYDSYYYEGCANQDYLRLGYGSLLSSWALMNAGPPEDGYGYWAKGQNSDGAAGGGFEPAPFGETWLDQPHHRGSWYYSCEIDLGFCGYLRNAHTLLLKDDIFGWYCFGGVLKAEENSFAVTLADGVYKRFHMVNGKTYIKLDCKRGRFVPDAMRVSQTMRSIACKLDAANSTSVEIAIESSMPIVKAEYGSKEVTIQNNIICFCLGAQPEELVVYFEQ